MVVVRLKGGLGNQMFQYAYGRALAQQHSARLLLDHSYLEDKSPKENFTYRDYELGAFGINQKPTKFQFNLLGLNRKSTWGRLVNRFWNFAVINDETPIDAFRNSSNFYLDGYFQSEKYFKFAEQLIRSSFEFSIEPLPSNSHVISEIKAAKHSVSIHIRRGDYLTIGGGGFYETCGVDYYQSAIREMELRLVDPTFFIFSADDPSWPVKNLKIKSKHFFVGNENVGKLGFENMRLMSLCQHNIIANSSFSWWAAWLNSFPEKLVIAPLRWFADEKKNVIVERDLIPSDWIKI